MSNNTGKFDGALIPDLREIKFNDFPIDEIAEAHSIIIGIILFTIQTLIRLIFALLQDKRCGSNSIHLNIISKKIEPKNTFTRMLVEFIPEEVR